MLMGIESEIGRVLVPGRDRVGMGILDEEGAGEHQDVGAEQRLHDVENARILDQLAHPGQADMELAPIAFPQGPPAFPSWWEAVTARRKAATVPAPIE